MKAAPFLIFLILIASCGEKKPAANSYQIIARASWLEGHWENKSPQGLMTESWEKANDSTFYGQSYFIKEKDTLHKETIVMAQRGETLTYSPTVAGQNADKPVEFKLTSSSESKLVFENPKHDYPKKIVYTKITKDSILVEISGVQQGTSGTDRFALKRKN